MKHTLILLALLGTTVTGMPQGTILFANTVTTLVSTNTYIGGPVAVISEPAGSYYFALLVAPTNQTTVDNSLSGWTFTGNYATNTSLAGRFSGGNVIVNGAAPGEPVNFVVVGWSQNIGHDWSAVLPRVMQPYSPGFVGISGIARNVILGGALDTNQWPTLNLRLPAGFILWAGCLGPYFLGFGLQPTNQTVTVGSPVEFVVGAVACPVPNYTWFFNGSPIAGGSSYRIAGAQPANAGDYFAVASGPYPPWCCGGLTLTSAPATLTVLISTQPLPAAQTVESGATVSFSVRADGYPPRPYPWFFNNTQALSSGIGNGTLRLTDVQFSQAGAYTVVLTNSLGTVTSLPAVLNVIPPVPRSLVPALALSSQAAAPLDLEFESSLGPPPNWSRLDSLDPTNHWYFDLAAHLTAQRFYRARQPNGSGVPPGLNLYLAPALTLSGTIGSSVRLDCINQIGPTDAWWTLDTVTLTNTSQLYFDTSSIGQPPRLWRIVPVP